MVTLNLDPRIEGLYRTEFHDRFRECWEGIDTVPPMHNTEHTRVVAQLTSLFSSLVDWDAGEHAVPGANLSDRVTGWTQNYRCPDVLVYLAGNPAVDHGTHWVGGPNLAVEIISDGEDPHAKLGFYAAVNTREVLVVERNPWAVELFTLADGGLYPARWQLICS